ncbi:MAG: hypothetical protein CMJ19_22375 [Phycisphaeraceae bacterium]|nr:hypothetical protein [Phycisphaeraceae bacterium]
MSNTPPTSPTHTAPLSEPVQTITPAQPDSTSATSEPLTYTYRQSILTKPWTFTLTNDAMSFQEEGRPAVLVAYSQIKQVKPKFDPTRVQRNRHVFDVHLNNGRTYKIASMTYKGINDFEDQAEQYTLFIKAFHERLANANTTVTYRKGISGLGYVASVGMLVFLFLLLIVAIGFMVTGTFNMIILAKFVLLLFFIPTLIRYLKKNKPSTYDPHNLPQDMLPMVDNFKWGD